jgi:hypothetical protein
LHLVKLSNPMAAAADYAAVGRALMPLLSPDAHGALVDREALKVLVRP